ncbi:TonB-dependent siderophore receptor [Candidimonas nitroreducens]|uniref:TonB-dependent siderophore receptor n=1 Tax=Candidimonas nitroreducens TaxID=683354 RepID=A0A225MXR7_9BURK|nr:TonB-dependent receptor [Candidimonas nitroreducens]OWT65862.1 TonB-dependent siderophore receptor [Candidimonas nitroreducens]
MLLLALGAGVPMCAGAADTAASPASDTAAGAGVALLPAVSVQGSREDSMPLHLRDKVESGALGDRSQLETPYSTTVVSSSDLKDRQVTKLGDVFAEDASVTDNSGAYSSWASYITVRGLPLDWQNAYRIDGKPFLSYAIVLPYEQFQQIDLLKGSSGFMYGFGSPGGLVNYVTKKPTDEPLRSLDIGYHSNSILSEHADIGGRAGSNGAFGYRLNATHEEGRTYNDGSLYRNSFSLALDARLSDALTWDFESIYQDRKTRGQEPSIYTGLYTDSSLPAPLRDTDQRLLGPGQHLDTNFQFYSTGLKYRLAPDWTLSTDFSYSKASRARNEGILYLTDVNGDYDDYRSDTRESHQFNQWQAMLEGKFATGSLKHHVVAGASWQKQVNNYSASSFYSQIGTGSLWAQNTNAYYSSGDYGVYQDSDIVQQALFASDTIDLTERWSILGGLRYTNYRQQSYTPAGSVTARYEQNGVVTPTVALMYKLQPRTMLYASYIESLEQGATVDDIYANGGQMLNPLVSKQYEFGIKTEQQRWAATAALFRIERGAQYANSENVLVQNGLSVYQGMELGASTLLGSNWRVGGNIMLLKASYGKGSSYDGERVSGAPHFVAAAQVSYSVPQIEGLTLRADAKYTGSTTLRPAGDLKLPSYTVFNLGASYDTRIAGHDTTFRLAVNNLADKAYWEYQYDNYIKPGDPRSISLNASVRF